MDSLERREQYVHNWYLSLIPPDAAGPAAYDADGVQHTVDVPPGASSMRGAWGRQHVAGKL